MTQERALEIMKSGKNVFLTGIAGAGKTFTLARYIDFLREKEVSFAVTASTGIVATALDGVTIHSFSALGIRDTLNANDLERISYNSKITPRIRAISVLIIDEISMLSAAQLDCVNAIFKTVRHSSQPFGGVQVIFCGDFLQLPPVKGNYAFESIIWNDMDIDFCYLNQAFRQKEDPLLDVLNAIRAGLVTDAIKKTVASRINAKLEKSTVLFTHNVDVDAYNDRELKKIQRESKFYHMKDSGNEKLCDQIRRNCLSPENLELRVGATVIVTKNDFKKGIVNGTMGTVTALHSNRVWIETFSGKEIEIEREKWSMLNERGNPIAYIEQIPLRLAYAITVHKSQGMTLDAARMDLSKVFTHGQGYVALSRLRSLSTLSLTEEVSDQTFLIDPIALEYEKELIKRSELS